MGDCFKNFIFVSKNLFILNKSPCSPYWPDLLRTTRLFSLNTTQILALLEYLSTQSSVSADTIIHNCTYLDSCSLCLQTPLSSEIKRDKAKQFRANRPNERGKQD